MIMPRASLVNVLPARLQGADHDNLKVGTYSVEGGRRMWRVDDAETEGQSGTISNIELSSTKYEGVLQSSNNPLFGYKSTSKYMRYSV